MKAVITGGAGFLGQKLARALLSDGHEVRLLVRNPQAVPADLPVAIAQGDLNDESSLDRAFEGMDWVFHAAGLISYNPQKAKLMHETNVVGTRNIATAALRQGVKRFIQTSQALSPK